MARYASTWLQATNILCILVSYCTRRGVYLANLRAGYTSPMGIVRGQIPTCEPTSTNRITSSITNTSSRLLRERLPEEIRGYSQLAYDDQPTVRISSKSTSSILSSPSCNEICHKYSLFTKARLLSYVPWHSSKSSCVAVINST